jgi:hypothetical protein
LEKRKRSRRRKLLYWLAIDIAVAATVIGMLIYKPARYHPAVPPASADANDPAAHPYLHRDLASTFYNNAQKQRPFDMVILDQSLNEAMARLKWQSEGVTLAAPQVFFAAGRIVLMGTADVEKAKFVVTIELAPRMDDKGYLDLAVEKVKVGAMNVTPLAKMIGRKMYREQINTGAVDMENLGTKIVASLLNGEPFDPMVEAEDKWVRLKSLDIAPGRLTAQFVPAKPGTGR